MNTKNPWILGSLALTANLSWLAQASDKAGHGAHVHGNAKLTLAVESPQKISLVLDAPGMTLLGFEHAAKSKADKATEKRVFDLLRDKFADLVNFPESAHCEMKASKVSYEAEEVDEPGHRDVNAEYEVNCASPALGHEVVFSFGKAFPTLKQLDVEILKSEGQNSTSLIKGNGKVGL